MIKAISSAIFCNASELPCDLAVFSLLYNFCLSKPLATFRARERRTTPCSNFCVRRMVCTLYVRLGPESTSESLRLGILVYLVLVFLFSSFLVLWGIGLFPGEGVEEWGLAGWCCGCWVWVVRLMGSWNILFFFFYDADLCPCQEVDFALLPVMPLLSSYS